MVRAGSQPVSPHAAPPPLPAAGETLKGILLMVAFATIAPGIDVFAKLATATLPPAEVSLARFVVQAGILLPVILALRIPRTVTPWLMSMHALRGVLLGLATVAFVSALQAMPIADAIAIFFVEPLIVTLLSAWLLREQVGPRRIAACGIGFVGALIVVRPSFEDLGWVATYPLVTAFCFAFYVLLTRHLARDENPLVMQMWAGVFGALLMAVFLALGEGTGSAIFDPVWPDARGWLLMLAVGLFATVSHLFLVYAFRYAAASVLAPLQYLEIVAATVFGYLVFGDFPDALKWLGIAIIVGSGLFVFWRERRAG